MSENLKPFVITRSTWLRGEGSSRSGLFRAEDGKQCCLGQFAERVCGIELMAMRDLVDLGEVRRLLPADVEEWEMRDDDVTLMEINDDPEISDSEREVELTRRFAALGYALAFED